MSTILQLKSISSFFNLRYSTDSPALLLTEIEDKNAGSVFLVGGYPMATRKTKAEDRFVNEVFKGQNLLE
eukprot:scaffold7214_cov75-Cylindrotheca_fusiformis.AAC.2